MTNSIIHHVGLSDTIAVFLLIAATTIPCTQSQQVARNIVDNQEQFEDLINYLSSLRQILGPGFDLEDYIDADLLESYRRQCLSTNGCQKVPRGRPRGGKDAFSFLRIGRSTDNIRKTADSDAERHTQKRRSFYRIGKLPSSAYMKMAYRPFVSPSKSRITKSTVIRIG
ncbi:hypothetical protein SNE40_001751 [Patella caerulea]|uniref:Uncharacterized protein n=1 Tax=Patella caerulea TaxID=87958 RepID=A0AAN8Q205_PATCE